LHYARHVFAGLKSIKNFGPLILRFDLPTLNDLAPALTVDITTERLCLYVFCQAGSPQGGDCLPYDGKWH